MFVYLDIIVINTEKKNCHGKFNAWFKSTGKQL